MDDPSFDTFQIPYVDPFQVTQPSQGGMSNNIAVHDLAADSDTDEVGLNPDEAVPQNLDDFLGQLLFYEANGVPVPDILSQSIPHDEPVELAMDKDEPTDLALDDSDEEPVELALSPRFAPDAYPLGFSQPAQDMHQFWPTMEPQVPVPQLDNFNNGYTQYPVPELYNPPQPQLLPYEQNQFMNQQLMPMQQPAPAMLPPPLQPLAVPSGASFPVAYGGNSPATTVNIQNVFNASTVNVQVIGKQ